jgi:hypothetical protein
MGRGAQSGGTKVLRMQLRRNGATAIVLQIQTCDKLHVRSRRTTALKELASVEKEAHAAGLVAIEFEARLALGEMERKAGQTVKARATLNALAQEAKARGFNLIAVKAGGAAPK